MDALVTGSQSDRNLGQEPLPRAVTGLIIACFAWIAPFVVTANGQEQASQSHQEGEIQTRGLQNLPLPTSPQKWQVNNRQPYGIGFGVTQPGAVTVDIQSQGAAVVVELFGAGPKAVQRQAGSGAIRLMYQVTPADVQRSALWQVHITLAQPGGPPAQATGTIVVQSPAADATIVRAQIQARRAQRLALRPQALVNTKTAADASVQAHKAQFQQQEAARRAAMLAQIQPELQAGQIGTRSVGSEESGTEASAHASEQEVNTRALQPSLPSVGKTPVTPLLSPPAITKVSVPSARPGDPVLITGTGFLEYGGQVTFELLGVGPTGGTVSYPAIIQQWHNFQILVTVPDISGIPVATKALITVTRGSDKKTSDPFGQFSVQPAMDLIEFPLPPPWGQSLVHFPMDWCVYEANLNLTPNLGISCGPSQYPPGWFSPNGWHIDTDTAGLFGDNGNDKFFFTTQLKYPWKVSDVEAVLLSNHCDVAGFDNPDSGNVYVAESHVGTNSPYLNVGVWLRPFCDLRYTIHIWILGPHGVPYQ